MPTTASLSDGTNIHLDNNGLTSDGLTEGEAIDYHFNPNPNSNKPHGVIKVLSGFSIPLMFYGVVKYMKKIPK